MNQSKIPLGRCELLPPSRFDEIGLAAEQLLWDTIGRGLPVGVEALTEKLQIIRKAKKLPKDQEGYIDLKRRPFWLVLNSRKSTVRQRFTEAHELGHFYLHDLGPILHRDSFDTVFQAHEGTSECRARIELEASEFAAALLMPKSAVEADLPRLASFASPASPFWDEFRKKYEVSRPAARQRVLRVLPGAVFHGFAFANTGGVMCAYPTVQLEKDFPGLSNQVWALNLRGDSSKAATLPAAVMVRFKRETKRHFSCDGIVPIFSEQIDCSKWFCPSCKGIKGILTMRMFAAYSELVYFRFQPDSLLS